MTIPISSRRNDYVGNGSVSTYAYGFKIFSGSGLTVKVRDTDDVETTLTLTTDYTVTGAGDAAGGTIVLVNASQAWLTGGYLKTGYALTILGIEPLNQETDIRNQGTYYPEAHEDTFDHLLMIDQQQQNQLDGSFRLPDTIDPDDVDTRLPVPEASKAIRWNSGADGLENYTPGSAEDVIFPGGTGMLAYDGSLNLITRTIMGGTGITIANGSGVSGNPTITPAYALVNGQTAETAPATDDELFIGDTSAAALKKMTFANFLKIINAMTADGTPDAAADYVATYDSSAAAVKKVLLQNLSGFKVKVGEITRNLADATGTVAYTGVGFTPKVVIFFSCINATTVFDYLSWGFSNLTANFSFGLFDAGTTVYNNTKCITIYESATSAQDASLSAFGVDGFSLNWVKGGSPTGIATIPYLAIG